MFIPIILGTARIGRESEKVANYVLEQVIKNGVASEILDVRNYRIPETNNTEEIPAAKKLEGIILKADGLIIVSPEYNHGYPGELKMMLDMLFKQYEKKPIGICGVSNGPVGGARMAQVLRLFCIGIHTIPIRNAIYFANVIELFDQNGKIKTDKYDKQVKGLLEEIQSYIKK